VLLLLALWLIDAAQLLFMPLSTSPALDWTAAPLAVNGIYAPLLPLTFLPGVQARTSDVVTFAYSALVLFLVAVITTALLVRGRTVIAHCDCTRRVVSTVRDVDRRPRRPAC